MRTNFCWSFEKGDLLPLLLVLPAVLLIIIVMIVPLLYGFVLSFYHFEFGNFHLLKNFAGLDNYLRIFKDQTALRSIINTLTFSFGAILGEMVLGTAIALLIFNLSRRIAALVRPIITIPLLISPIVVGLIWRYIYDPRGILYWFLGKIGITIEHFPGVTASSTALLSTIIAHWWEVVPFVVIVLTAGLVSIPSELYEAAKIDGAGGWKTFARITFPLLIDVYMVILLISGVDTLKVFDIIYSLTGGGPNNSTVSTSIYAFNQAFSRSDMSYAMALSMVTIMITFIIFGIPFIRRNRKRIKESQGD